MNKAITQGLALMPSPFRAGLANWSPGEGVSGSTTYAGAANATVVFSDADFGTCLELSKTTATQKVRHRVAAPWQVGMYLRVTVRAKVISGPIPQMRISCLPVNAAGVGISSLPASGAILTPDTYGEVVTLTMILGSGARGGVDLVWGTSPAGVHVGLELLGATGAVLRIADIVVEDMTSLYLREMLDWVDVRDYGAIGDGTTNNAAAFAAADAAALALGSEVLVPQGQWYLGGNMTFSSPVRFEGTVVMPASARLSLSRDFNLEAYARAFGSEIEGFRRGMQALFHFTDHVTFDLKGRSVQLSEPLLVAENAGMEGASYANRRQVSNGQLTPIAGPAWTPNVVTAQASFSTAEPYLLTGVANIAAIEVGSLVTGAGVARETYVRSKNVGAGTIELSLSPGSQGGTRNYTFTRNRYMLDFLGFGRLDRFEITDVEFLAQGNASCVMLPPWGITTRFQSCVFNRPAARAITSVGTGCQGMMIDECQFLSNEQGARVQDRTTVAFNVNANDVKVRDNRAVRFRHFGVMHGSGHMFVGNHWFQGDSESPGVRSAGIVLTGINIKTLITGNYVDNSFIEMTNEREQNPNWANQFSFGGLTVTGNIFTANDVVSSFAWIVVTPRGTGHYLQGVSISDNTFRTLNGAIDRVEKVDTTWADLDYGRFRNITVHGNNYNGITKGFYNPLTIRHDQNTASTAWTVDAGGFLAFGGRARVVTGLVPIGEVKAGSVTRYEMPSIHPDQGAAGQNVTLRWPAATTGSVWVTLRSDNPV